jgi:hypothetical protein
VKGRADRNNLEQDFRRPAIPTQCGNCTSVKRKGHQLAILSAEDLGNPGMADLLAGLDSQYDVWVIFYLRPTAMDTIGLEAMGPENGSIAQRFRCSVRRYSH